MGQLEQAAQVYREGFERTGDESLKKGFEDAVAAMQQQRERKVAEIFADGYLERLAAHPDSAAHVKETAVRLKLEEIARSPAMLDTHATDPKVEACLKVLLDPNSAAVAAAAAAKAKAEAEAAAAAAASAEPELTEEEKAALERRNEALAAKEAGNSHFKRREFEAAIEHYRRAIGIDPSNGMLHNNVAAVLVMQKKFEEAVAECERALEVGHPDGATSMQVAAKALARKGTALQRLGRLDEALKALDASMVEKADRKVDKQRRDIRKEMARRKEEEYLDKDKSEEAKARGAELFKNNDFAGAIAEYTEALKRDPTNFRARSNRALAFTKLMQWQPALEDCDAIIKQEPSFVKAYVRKGKIQQFLKQFDTAAETFQLGLGFEPANPELIQCMVDLQRAVSNLSPEDKERRAAEAMKRPDIQQLLKDPMVTQAIRDLQSPNPEVSNRVRNNPEMFGKIRKLIAAGVLRTD